MSSGTSLLINSTSILSDANLSGILPSLSLPSDCYLGTGRYSAQCINEWFCPQIPNQMVNLGIGLIISYVLASWLIWFFNTNTKSYSLVADWLAGNKITIFGDVKDPMRRAVIIDWIKSRFITAFLVYIGVTAWMYSGLFK